MEKCRLLNNVNRAFHILFNNRAIKTKLRSVLKNINILLFVLDMMLPYSVDPTASDLSQFCLLRI
jgi:hypothetical protein